MKNFVDYTSRKCFASAHVASPRLRNITHTRKISFSGLVIQITIAVSHIMIVPVLYGMQFILYCMARSLFCIMSNKTHFGSCSKEKCNYLGILFDKNTVLKHKTVFVFFWFD
jgi:hypothetical protein